MTLEASPPRHQHPTWITASLPRRRRCRPCQRQAHVAMLGWEGARRCISAAAAASSAAECVASVGSHQQLPAFCRRGCMRVGCSPACLDPASVGYFLASMLICAIQNVHPGNVPACWPLTLLRGFWAVPCCPPSPRGACPSTAHCPHPLHLASPCLQPAPPCLQLSCPYAPCISFPRCLQAVPQQFLGQGVQERVRCHCVAEGFDRYALQDAILRREGSLQAYADVLISDYHRTGDTWWAGWPGSQGGRGPGGQGLE